VVLVKIDRPDDFAVDSKADESMAPATVLELSTWDIDMEIDDGTAPLPLEMANWLVVNWPEEPESVAILLELPMIFEEDEILLAWAAELDDAAILLEEVAPRLLYWFKEFVDPAILLEEVGGTLVLLELLVWGRKWLHDCSEELAAAAIVEKLEGFAELKNWLGIWVDDIGVNEPLEPKFEPVILPVPCETIVLLVKAFEVDEVETPGVEPITVGRPVDWMDEEYKVELSAKVAILEPRLLEVVAADNREKA
jgi:hypothetical protein